MAAISRTASALALTCLLAAGCKSAPRERPIPLGPVNTGAGSVTAARKFLEGRWVLESFEVYPPGESPITLKGSGDLLYDEFGNLKMEIRADQKSSDLLRAAGIDIRDGVISTEGRTAIDLQNHTLTYIVQGQVPNKGPLAINRPRHWEVQNDRLTLTTKDESGKPLSVGRWRRGN